MDKPRQKPAPERAKPQPKPEGKQAAEPPRSSCMDSIRERLDRGIHGKFAGLLRAME